MKAPITSSSASALVSQFTTAKRTSRMTIAWHPSSLRASVALKLRTLAGDFQSASFSHKATVTLGFWRGGPAPFGYRRQAVDENGAKRALLKPGEQKHFRTERVILVPAPKREIEIVRRIFRDFAICRRIRSQIADELNARDIYNSRGKPCIPTLAEIVGPAHLDRLKAKRRMLVHHHMVYSTRHRPR